MQNLESLLQTPYGCGEQNIAQLASDVYILDYLKATDQLTEELKSKAQRLLSNGERVKSFPPTKVKSIATNIKA